LNTPRASQNKNNSSEKPILTNLPAISISKAKNFPQSDIFSYYSNPENCTWGNDGMYGISKLLEQYIARKLSALALGPDGTYVFLFSMPNIYPIPPML